MKVTISDVAKIAGVSKSTVSRILNGNYGQNTEETIKRVLSVIEELDYRPNALAKGLKSMKTNVIGIVLSNLQNPFWANVLQGVEDTCREYGYNLMICNSNEEAKLEEEHIRSFEMKQVDGIIVNATLKNMDIYKRLIDSKFPFISINRKIYGLELDTVVVDNIKGSKLAIDHFVQLGYQKIAVFVYPLDQISPRIERIEGYKEGLKNNGIEFDPSLIYIVPEKKDEVKKSIKNLFSGLDRPDAIFSTNNMMTLELLEGLKEININVPNDVAIIGYDETVWSKHLNPPLTTVYQPSYEMGELAAKKLIKLINKDKKVSNEKEKTLVKTTSLEPHLILRESCGNKIRRAKA